MKKLFFAAAVAAFAFASCNNEEYLINETQMGEYEYATLNLSTIDGGVTRALTSGTVPSGYNIRYKIQVFSPDGLTPLLAPNCWFDANNDGSEANVKIKVPKGVDFKIVAWADLSKAAAATDDYFFNTTDMKAISFGTNYNVAAINGKTGSAEWGNWPSQKITGDPHGHDVTGTLYPYDAYFTNVKIASVDFLSGTTTTSTTGAITGAKAISLTLTRPFARINIFTLDTNSFLANTDLPAYSRVDFTAPISGTGTHGFYSKFNATIGDIATAGDRPIGQSSTPVTAAIISDLSMTIAGGTQQMAVVYLFSDKDFDAARATGTAKPAFDLANFTITTKKTSATVENFSVNSLTNIPFARNCVTNIYGGLLTDEATLTIEIIDEFENHYDVTTVGNPDNNQNGINDGNEAGGQP